MADNVIHLKIVIDGKEVSAELKEADELLKKLKKSSGGAADGAKKIGASKQDIGRFSGEIIGAVGATGKLGSHLNTLASGLLTGGFIGGAFAGAAALISGIVDSMDDWKDSIETVKSIISIESDDEKFIIKAKDISNKLKIAREERDKEYATLRRLGYIEVTKGLTEQQEKELEIAREQREKWLSIIENLEEEEKQFKDKAEMLELINKKLKTETDVWSAQGKTISEINKQIDKLEKDLGKTVYQSKQYYEILSDIKKLEASIGLGDKKEARPDVPEIEVKTGAFIDEDIILGDVKLLYGSMLDYARLSKEQELELWYNTEKKKVEGYTNSEEVMMALDAEHAQRKKDLAEEEKRLADEVAQTKMEAAGNALSFIAGATAEHTALHKVASAAQATISTYTAAVEALKAGPILGPIFAAIITGLGMANVAKILSTETPKATGYATGGFAMVGERGPEIIAPVTDYAKGQALLVAHTISTLRSMSSPFGRGQGEGSGGGMQELISAVRDQNNRIENWNRELNFRFKSGEFVSGSNKALAKYNDLKF